MDDRLNALALALDTDPAARVALLTEWLCYCYNKGKRQRKIIFALSGIASVQLAALIGCALYLIGYH